MSEWNKMQMVAVKAKYESKHQYYELEISSLKTKCAKLIKVRHHRLKSGPIVF
jgi:hypothetical protein